MSDHEHTPDLNLCPFCGGKGSIVKRFLKQVFCTVCGAKGPKGETVAETLHLWNTRTDAAEIATLKAQRDELVNLLIECRRWFLNMSYENMRKHISDEIDRIKAGKS